jgi:hypothetical protein
MLTWDKIQANAIAFSKRWKEGWDEKSEAQSFVRDFLAVFGVQDAAAVGRFEERALRESGKGFMDYFWPKQIAIEMKTKGKNLETAYKQLLDYIVHLPAAEMPDLLVVSDFENIILYRRTTAEKFAFKTKDLRKHIKRFANIAGYETTRIYENQVEVNIKAAEKMAKLHDALKTHGYEGHDLEVYLVRLLFCLFADDTGIFPKDSLFNYIENSKEDGSDLSERIAKLFEILNMPEEMRAKRTLLADELKQFCYINGGLFANLLPSAEFDGKMRQTLLDCANFDWNKISPAIFGAMFQGVMDKAERRELGAHYTSEENILKLINPLFMDELWREYDRVKTDPVQLDRFHEKISCLKFLDPACGCGNFLIITYRELRLLELELLKMTSATGQLSLIMDVTPLLKVNVEQFYGIEYEDFPCQIAQVGMWLMDHQMNLCVAEQFGIYYTRLPLTQSATIVNGNALRLDWEDVVPKRELSYILGNPPFVGHQWRTAEQAEDMKIAFYDLDKHGKLDYVCSWYNKAADMLLNSTIKAAFVSTNSIVQGESAVILWRHMLIVKQMQIDFAYRTFKWSNEAKGKAAVHCVMVGFSHSGNRTIEKKIYDGHHIEIATNINGYLLNADNIFITPRGTNINKELPKIIQGNKPWDGGFLILNEDERKILLAEYPESEPLIRPFIGANEFINKVPRYCLWLEGIAPSIYRNMPPVKERLSGVAEIRRNTKTAAVQKQAETPMLFSQIRQPDTDYLCIPEVSSENRRYIPIGYLTKDVIASNKLFIIPDATLYLFGVLTSNVHMAWTRVVCGRLKSDYSYSPAVYNNFPWPDVTNEQKSAIEQLAQGVLDTRAIYDNQSLADLYDPLTMPPELLKAHRALDKAVMQAYGFAVKDTTEVSCVATLMERYQKLTVK